MPNRALMDLAMGCAQLRYLDITRSSTPRFGGGRVLSSWHWRCTQVGDEGVATVVRCCPELRALLLALCGELGDNSLRAIAHFAANLEAVSFLGTSRRSA
jgi:hypothetical protein